MKTIVTLAAALALFPMIAIAQAGGRYGGEDRGKPPMPAQVNAKWKEECGGCHIAYAPGLLPAASWRKVMAELDKHFGSDASLLPAERGEIAAFLERHASNRWPAMTAPLRITESGWFRAKHGAKDIPPEAWKRASIKSRANCQACHPRAASGDFSERDLKIPE